jgi:alpha-maltose-1-phosphate synthase
MRIAIVHFGGMPNYSNFLIKSILDCLNNTIVFAPYAQKQFIMEITENNSHICFYDKPRMRNPSNIKIMGCIVSSIESYKPDVIHLLEYYPWMHFYLKHLARFPLVATIHDPIKHIGDIESWRVPFFRGYYKYISQFIVLGNHMRDLFAEKYGIDYARINVVPHGNSLFYLERFSSNIPEKKNTILFFGRLYKYKGIEYLVKAEPNISRVVPDVQFVIAGRGSKRYLKAVKQKIIHQNKFVFHEDYISDEMMAQLFQEASLVALPYVESTQSGVLMMAYAFKKPVVVTNVGSLPEYVDEEETGFIVPPRDSSSMAGRINKLLLDENLRKTMGETGYRKSMEELSWEQVGQQTLDVYRKACG